MSAIRPINIACMLPVIAKTVERDMAARPKSAGIWPYDANCM